MSPITTNASLADAAASTHSDPSSDVDYLGTPDRSPVAVQAMTGKLSLRGGDTHSESKNDDISSVSDDIIPLIPNGTLHESILPFHNKYFKFKHNCCFYC